MMDNFKGAVTEAQSAAEGLGVAVFERVSEPLTGLVDVAADAMGAITKALTPPPRTDLEQFLDNVQDKIKDTKATIESLGDVDLIAVLAGHDRYSFSVCRTLACLGIARIACPAK